MNYVFSYTIQMARNDTECNRNKYVPVRDERNRRVRGLWCRNGVYYIQLRLRDLRHPAKIRLHGETLPQAKASMQEVLVKRRSNEVDYRKRAGIPKLSKLIDNYVAEREALKDKRPATIAREKSSLDHWKEFMPDALVNRLEEKHLFEFAAWMRKRRPNGTGRAVDVAVIAIRAVLMKAFRDGHLRGVPSWKWKAIAKEPRSVRLLPGDEIDHLVNEGLKLPQGRQFTDYLRLLQYSGAREKEALRLRWADVNFDLKQITIGSDKLSKNGKSRTMPMSDKLRDHLLDMQARRKPDEENPSKLLFPSRVKGRVIRSYKSSLNKVKKVTGFLDVGFHHFRHYFISQCVMAGIDYLTIAEWVGHQDGGVMIGTIYGHLNNEHQKKQAAKLSF